MTGKRVVIYRHSTGFKPLKEGQSRCPDCGRGVRLTKHGRLATHNTKRDGGSLCPGAGLNP